MVATMVVTTWAKEVYEPTWESLDQRKSPSWFQDAKFGVFIHWGVYSVPAWGPKDHYAENYAYHLYQVKRDVEVNFHKKNYGKDFPYYEFAPKFRAELFDSNAWARTFKDAGIKYVVLTSKHTDSYCLWPAPDSKAWNSSVVGPKRDICGELTDAVKQQQIKMGFYYCHLEWYHPFSDLYWTDVPRYVQQRLHPQIKDLVTRYQPDVLWGDGEWDHHSDVLRTRELLAWLFNESPVKDTIVINDRWGKGTRQRHGGYHTTEYTPGKLQVDHPWEECRGMGHSFGYNRAETARDYKSSKELVHMLVDIVSRGGNLLLDIGPAADGRIPEIMEERLLEMGQWLHVNDQAIYGTRPWRIPCQWSAGKRPSVDYTKEYMSAYNVTDLTKKQPGQASIEAFFTVRDGNLYAIAPRWPDGGTLILEVPRPADDAKIRLLGYDQPLSWRYAAGELTIDVSKIGINDLPGYYAWTFELPNLAEK